MCEKLKSEFELLEVTAHKIVVEDAQDFICRSNRYTALFGSLHLHAYLADLLGTKKILAVQRTVLAVLEKTCTSENFGNEAKQNKGSSQKRFREK